MAIHIYSQIARIYMRRARTHMYNKTKNTALQAATILVAMCQLKHRAVTSARA